ncbi:MAG: hypothetical protein GX352_00315 [Clostridiales bacterium]|nr:hypothetical protein [Clostridiales bacterium]
MKNKKFFLLIIILCVATAISLTATLILLNNKTKPVDVSDKYPPVMTDPEAEPVEEETTQPPLENPEGGGAVSLTYSGQAVAPKGDGVADIMFENPAKSNQDVIIQLQITDKELIEKIGKTGRTMADKAKIEDAEDYDSKDYRMVVGESGLISPGYKLESIQLNALPDGTVLPKGIYNAIYYISPYDKETNERAMVNVQIPIMLVIEK